MFIVYWSEVVNNETVPKSKSFDSSELTETLKFSEELRARRRNGELISFITMCSELSNSVGQQGVSDVGVGYDWKKRR